MNLFIKRLLSVLTVLCPMLWLVGCTLMLINMGIIHIKFPAASSEKDLIYNGEYVDLLIYGQQEPLNESDTRVTMIDQRTGLPATAKLTLVDKNGKETACVNVVRFTYQGLPAMLRFTDNVVDGFTYLDCLNPTFNPENNIKCQWETDPNFLQEALNKYASQVLTVLK